MIDPILQHQPTWRYCNVRAGEKRPYPANWQHNPLLLDQVESANIGLLLGPLGNGVMAVDFDGTSAWSWLEQQGVDYRSLPSTPTWASGKQDRCQMAFSVPIEFWPHLRTKKIATGEGEGFEFRWAGGQSVLPPSQHPTTGRPYEWLIPATEPMADIPGPLLAVWTRLLLSTPEPELDQEPEKTLDTVDQFEINEAESILKILRDRHPSLSYQDWLTVTWGIAHHVGREAASVLMPMYYPEKQPGEYRQLLRTWNKAKSPKLGSVMYLAGLKRK